MYCNNCNQENDSNNKICKHCQYDLKASSAKQSNKQVELWDPKIAALLCFICTPIFSAYIHTKNWEALGETQKAVQSKKWIFINFLSLVYPFGILLLPIWYVYMGKQQLEYIEEKFGDQYIKKSWQPPLFIFFGIFLFLVILFIIYLTISKSKLL